MVFLFLLPVLPHTLSLQKEMVKIALLAEGSTAFRAGLHFNRISAGILRLLFHQILTAFSILNIILRRRSVFKCALAFQSFSSPGLTVGAPL
jgi:hypothetical protein